MLHIQCASKCVNSSQFVSYKVKVDDIMLQEVHSSTGIQISLEKRGEHKIYILISFEVIS